MDSRYINKMTITEELIFPLSEFPFEPVATGVFSYFCSQQRRHLFNILIVFCSFEQV